MSKKEQIIEEIRKIYDPELPVNIYELGLIYDIKVEDDKFAKIKMTLTTPNCPVAESLPKEVKDGAMQVEGIEDVDLELVWDPPWNKVYKHAPFSLKVVARGFGNAGCNSEFSRRIKHR
jgi:FeS assembly SUF system protein